MHDKPERVYRYPKSLGYMYICGYILGGVVSFSVGVYATILLIVMMTREGEPSTYLRAIGVALFLTYVGINFLYVATNRFPIKIVLGEDGVRLLLFRRREVTILWHEIKIARNYGLIFRFRRSVSGLSQWLILKDYVVFPFMKGYWDFVRQFRIRHHGGSKGSGETKGSNL
jgi:hypothetical protein